MPSDLETISHICLYLQDKNNINERINEISLFSPLLTKAPFEEKSPALIKRKWTVAHPLSILRRATLKIQRFAYKHISHLVPQERLTQDVKFKTALALLLSSAELREFFLGSYEKRRDFEVALQKGALSLGLTEWQPPVDEDDPLLFARALTYLPVKELSLLDNPYELKLQRAVLEEDERRSILCAILENFKRSPITSVLEIDNAEGNQKIIVTTRYAKVKIEHIDETSGKITFLWEEDRAFSSLSPSETGTKNQRIASDHQTKLGAYCGALLNRTAVLEEVFFLLCDHKPHKASLLKTPPQDALVEDKSMLFTSLFSWSEYEHILAQSQACDALHGTILAIEDLPSQKVRYVRLHLYYHNISLSAWNKFPTPAEVKASLKDIEDEMLLSLSERTLRLLQLPLPEPLPSLKEKVEEARLNADFLIKQQGRLDAIDRFRPLIKKIITLLAPSNHETALVLKALLTGKLTGIDKLIYVSLLSNHLGIIHNKNCEEAIDRAAAADAIDKAQSAFRKICKKAFLPGEDIKDESALFKVLYSIYLVFEEPELTAAMSTGFIGEKFYRNFVQKNPETTHYLTTWLRRHPELYLGLSEERF